jgi:hypothetical protein
VNLDLWIAKWLDAPAGYASQSVGTGGASVSLSGQLTRHLVVSVGATPNGPIDQLGTPRLGASAGGGWSFENGVELAVSGGSYNVLARPSWDQTIPGRFAGLSITTWF